MTASNTYAPMFKAWSIKQLGPRPTDELLSTIHGIGARPGKQALANAMMLRDCGATAAQIVMACGAPQLNKMRALVTSGYVKREAVPASPEGHTVYKLTLTPKGGNKVKQAEARAVAAAENAKATPEADKPKGKGNKAAKRAAKLKAAKADTASAATLAPEAPEAAPEAVHVEPATAEAELTS